MKVFRAHDYPDPKLQRLRAELKRLQRKLARDK